MEAKDLHRIFGKLGLGLRDLVDQLNEFLAGFSDDELVLLADLFEAELDNRQVDKEAEQ